MAKKLLSEEQVKSLIYKMVRESLESMPSDFNFEGNQSGEDGETEKEKKIRTSVEAQLKKPGINIAPYAYKLDGIDIDPENGDDNAHKNARSKLYKKINHKPDSNGNPESLSPEEAIELYNDLSGELSESKNGKVLMTKNEFTSFINEMVMASVKKVLKEMVDHKRNHRRCND